MNRQGDHMSHSRMRWRLSAAMMLASLVAYEALAAEPEEPSDDQGDTKFAKARPWDASTDFPRPIAQDASVTYDYPIVYVRVPRPYPKDYFNINQLNQAGLHQTNAPGAELRLLHPDG